jgi:hypothetical protein
MVNPSQERGEVIALDAIAACWTALHGDDDGLTAVLADADAQAGANRLLANTRALVLEGWEPDPPDVSDA